MRVLKSASVFLLAIGFLFLFSGCASEEDIEALEEEIEILQESIEELKAELSDVQELQREMATDLLGEAMKEQVLLDLSSPAGGYLQMKPRSGPGQFLVVFEDVEEYMDGYRVWLRIGNPLNMTFDSFSLQASWGDDMTHETNYTQQLQPGSWHAVDLVITPFDTSEHGYTLLLSMKTDQVLLYTR